MAVISKLVALLGVDPREFDKNLKAAEKTLSKTAARMQSIGRDLTVNVTLPLAAVGGAAVKAFADFDSAMVKSTAIMGDVTDKMAEMEEAALEVARTTTFSATQAAEAFFFLASAGLDAQESIDALPATAQFAQAGMFDLATATDLLTDAQSALGLTIRDNSIKNMENMVRVSDVLVKANSIANAKTREFAESLTNQAGAAARFNKITLEETVAVLAVLADQGTKGAEAGTKFSIVLRDLTTKAIRNAEAFKRFGIEVFDANRNVRPLADIIENLDMRLGNLSVEAQKAALLQLGFADRSVQVTQALLGTQDALRGYLADLRDAGGTTAEVADKQMQAFSSQMILLKNSIMEVLIALGKELIPIILDDLVPVVQDVIEFLAKVVKKFGELDTFTKKIIVGFTAFAAVIGPVIIAIGAFLKILTAVAAVLGGPAIALIIAGGALLTGLGILATELDEASAAGKRFNGTLQEIGDTAKVIVDETGKVVFTVEQQFQRLSRRLEMLVAQEAELKEALVNPFKAFKGVAIDTAEGVKEFNERIFRTKLELAAVGAEIDRVSMSMMDLAEAPTISPGGQIFPDQGEPVSGDTTGIGKLIEGFKMLGSTSMEVFQGIADVGGKAFLEVGRTIDGVVITNSERLENFFRLISERQEEFRIQANAAWLDYLAVATDVVTNVKLATLDFLTGFAAGFGDAIAQIIVFQKDFEEVMLQFLKNLLAEVVSTLTEIVAQWLLATIAQAVIGTAIHGQRVAQQLQLVYLNAFNAYAGIPIVGPIIAPGLAAVAVGVATAGSIAASATGPAVAAAGTPALGLDTGGLILADGLANLHQGERVLTRQEVRMMPEVQRGMMQVTVELDGRILTAKILPRVPHELRMRGI